MAYIATIKIAVNEAEKVNVYDKLNEVLRDAQYGGPNGEDRGWIVDWKFESVIQTDSAIDDSIANDTYAKGDAFRDRVIHSQDGAGLAPHNNEGGRSCDAIKDIPAEQLSSPFKLVVDAYATSEYGDYPSWAEVTVTQEFLQKLRRLRHICQANGLESVTVAQGPDAWDDECGILLANDQMVVCSSGFWFESYPKHADYSVETQMIKIDRLIQVAEALSGNNANRSLPDKCVIRNGIVFYDPLDPEKLAEWYLNRE